MAKDLISSFLVMKFIKLCGHCRQLFLLGTPQCITLIKTDSLFTGTFIDPWFGEVVISKKNGKLWFNSKRSSSLTGELLTYKGNTFIVKWNDRSMDADAFVMFNLDSTGKAYSIKMKAISPLTDFSFDFQNLDFIKLKNDSF